MSGLVAAAPSSDSKPDDAVKEFVGSDSVAEIIRLLGELAEIEKTVSGLAKTVLKKAIRIGELLVANKAAVRHRDWLTWIDKNLPFGCRQSQKYMSIYERRDELRALANANSNSYLSIDGWLRSLRERDREAAGAKIENPTTAQSEPKPAAEQKPKSADDQIPSEPYDEEAIWRRRLLERAQKAIRLARFFEEAPSCEAYQDVVGQKFTFDSELIDAAAFAAAAWQKLADYLRSRLLAQEAKEIFNGTVTP
jgi:hypothetical protein